MKRTTVIFLFILLFLKLNAQDYVFEKITTQQGLSQNDVNCVFQDHRGFIWIGTNDGLNRYDGYTFKTFRIGGNAAKNEGLASNIISKIKEDDEGNLWIGTPNEGLCKFDIGKEQFTQIRNTITNPNRIADNHIYDIECMDDGTVWIATSKGVNIISEENGKIRISTLSSAMGGALAHAPFNCISEDDEGQKWLGYNNGIVICKNDGFDIQTSFVPELKGSAVRHILFSKYGVFVGVSQGLYFLQKMNSGDSDYYTVKRFSNIVSRDLILDKNNNLFVSTSQGLYIFSCQFGKDRQITLKAHIKSGLAESELNRNIVTSLIEDSSGIIWIGTNGGGVNKYNPKRKKFRHYKSTGLTGSLSNNKIRAIFEDSRHNIWFGTEGGGLNFLDHSGNRNFDNGFTTLSLGNNLLENNIYTIIEVGKGENEKIWAGTGYPFRLVQFDIGKDGNPVFRGNPLPEIPNAVFTMLKDKDGNIWLGTYGSFGLYKYSQTANGYELSNYKADGQEGDLSSNIIRSLLQDNKGNIWIATDAGLNVLPYNQIGKEKPYFKVYRHKNDDKQSLSYDYVLPLFQSTTGDLWAGTMGGGLNKINYSDNLDSITFTRFSTSNGFPNDVIKGILEDKDGFLWISSNKGLTRFDPKTSETMNFDISDGLQDFEFGELACCKLSDGMMVFGGVNGFNTFYPEQIIGDMTLPKVAFTDLQVLNESVHVGEKIHSRVILDKVINQTKTIKLKYSENSFAIYFASLHFSAPSKNKYKYMLEGFDNNWIVKRSNEHFAKYTSLKPGKYVFKLYASNNDGVWSKSPREIEIIVVPPWWESNIALIIYFLLFVAILLFFQRYSIIRIKQKNELMMEHFEKEKIEELSQMKFRFFTNISHEFRTPLTLIIGSVQKLLKSHTDLPSEIREKYSIIHHNSSIMLRLINQLMDFRKLEQGKMKMEVSEEDLVPFIKNVETSFQDIAVNKGIRITCSYPENSVKVWIDVDKMEKIIYNLLSNAIKFTNQGGHINLNIIDDTESVIIQVKDDGVGIPKETQVHIFERFYQATKLKQPNFAGTGIGLSYSKGLAELHHGDIRFTSAEGEGSCFEILIRKGKDHYSQSEIIEDRIKTEPSIHQIVIKNNLAKRGQKSTEEQKIDSKKRTLLIVEDNQELLNFLSESFGEDYNIYIAENGMIGLDLALEYDIDLIISDIGMPLKDGFELCSEIKADERLSHIPVILLTAKTTAEDTVKGYQAGADAYVPKPFDFDVLEVQVKSIIQNREELRNKVRQSIEVEPSEVTTTSADEKFLRKLLSIIEENISNFDFTVEQLAELYGLPQVNINKKLKSLTGLTTNAFVRSIRLKRASQLLKTGRYSVADVTYEVGFSDLKYFRSCFKKEFNLTPSAYIKQHQSDDE